LNEFGRKINKSDQVSRLCFLISDEEGRKKSERIKVSVRLLRISTRLHVVQLTKVSDNRPAASNITMRRKDEKREEKISVTIF
jgi:hypothetical protein